MKKDDDPVSSINTDVNSHQQQPGKLTALCIVQPHLTEFVGSAIVWMNNSPVNWEV